LRRLLSLLGWLLKAVFFFTLFAFALNNQHDVTVHFFFGHQWVAPLVVVVLITLIAGVILGVLAMVPRWWRQNKTPAGQPVVPSLTSPNKSAAAKDDGQQPPMAIPPPDSPYGP
jgi:putative membrane protein